MLEQLKICSPYVRQTRPLCCQALWLRRAGSADKSVDSVGSADKSVDSVGSADKSVGLLHLYTLRNALKISLVQTKSAECRQIAQKVL